MRACEIFSPVKVTSCLLPTQLLVAMALYDLCAVLVPGGPLRVGRDLLNQEVVILILMQSVLGLLVDLMFKFFRVEKSEFTRVSCVELVFLMGCLRSEGGIVCAGSGAFLV